MGRKYISCMGGLVIAVVVLLNTFPNGLVRSRCGGGLCGLSNESFAPMYQRTDTDGMLEPSVDFTVGRKIAQKLVEKGESYRKRMMVFHGKSTYLEERISKKITAQTMILLSCLANAGSTDEMKKIEERADVLFPGSVIKL